MLSYCNLLEGVTLGDKKLLIGCDTISLTATFTDEGSFFGCNFDVSYGQDAYSSSCIMRPLGEVGESVKFRIIRYIFIT